MSIIADLMTQRHFFQLRSTWASETVQIVQGRPEFRVTGAGRWKATGDLTMYIDSVDERFGADIMTSATC